MASRGVEIAIQHAEPHVSAHPNVIPPSSMQQGGTLGSAVQAFCPDIVHFHWLTEAHERYRAEVRAGIGKPMTVRGHSFDFSVDRARDLTMCPDIRVLWLFPHQARQCVGLAHLHKISALSVAFSDRYFPISVSPRTRGVMRARAGVPGKGLRQWCEIAADSPEKEFTLYATRGMPGPASDRFESELHQMATCNMVVYRNASHPEIYKAMSGHRIYLVTAPHHAFGMSVGIAEAMASGLIVVAPDSPEYRSYIGPTGVYFAPGKGAEALDQAWSLSAIDRGETTLTDKVKRWAYRYHADAVLPKILGYWRSLVRLHSTG
jgi:hypothetical protein